MTIENQELEDIGNIARLGPWIKALVVAAFLLGGWVTGIQFQLNSLTSQVNDLEESKQSREEKFDLWKDRVIQETTELKTELRSVKEAILEVKLSLKESHERK